MEILSQSSQTTNYEKKHVDRGSTYIGFRNITHLAEDNAFNITMCIGIILSYSCVIVDFTEAVIGRQNFDGQSEIITGSLKDVLFCFDFIFFVDILLSMTQRQSNSSVRPMIFLALDIISIIPLELVYITLDGYNVLIIYGIRLRYTLRLSGLVYYINKQKKLQMFSICLVITNIFIIMSMFCLTFTCAIIIVWCNTSMFSHINCENLQAMDYFIIFFRINGLITECESLFTEFAATGNYLMYTKALLAAVQFILVVGLMQIMSMIICTYIVIFSKKFHFATMSSIIMHKLKEHKQIVIGSWSVKDLVFEDFVKNYIKMKWLYDKNKHTDDQAGYDVVPIPAIIRTELALDVSWNMFKHSMIFKDEEVHFLRRLSSYTSYKVMSQGETVYLKGTFKHEMIYIVSGVVQVMSEENFETPIISFGGGTCLGEMALFISFPAATTLVCQTQCEMITLPFIKFLKCRKYYPEIYKKLKLDAMNRLEQAKNYYKIGEIYYEKGYVDMKKEIISLRYIKSILRKYIGNQDTSNLFGNILAMGNVKEELDMTKTILCAEYLTLYVLAAERDASTTMHFLKTGIQFKLNPNSLLISFWNFILYILIVLTYVIFPFGSTLPPSAFTNIYDKYMTLITVFWCIDFWSFACIGIQDHDMFYRDFDFIFHSKVQTVGFWLDLISFLPLDLIIDWLEGPINRQFLKLLQFNRLLKAYKLITCINEKQFMGSKQLLMIVLLKMLITFICLVLLGVYIVVYTKTSILPRGDNDYFWYAMFIIQFYFSSALIQLNVDSNFNMLPLIGLQYIIFLWKLYVLPKIAAAISLAHTIVIEYENMVEDIRKVCILHSVDSSTRKKLYKYLCMHYHCGKGIHVLRYELIKSFIGMSMFKTLKTMKFYHLFANEGVFGLLPYHLIRDMHSIAQFVLIPKGEFVIYAGAPPKEIYIIVHGVCGYMCETVQGRLFLKRAVAGDSLCVIEVLSRVNVTHNIVTLSDCELLCIPYHLLVRKFIKYPNEYEILNNALKETVNPTILANLQYKEMTSFDDSVMDEDKSYKIFRKNNVEYWLGFGKHKILSGLLLRVTFRPYGRFWIYWEIIHITLIYISFLIGTIPMTLCKGVWSGYFWMYRFFDLMSIVDIYLRHHVFYYDSRNIEVTHPVKTAVHYWKSSFIIDFISALPFEIITLFILEERRVIFITLTRTNRFLQFYRMLGLKKYLNELYLSDIKYFHLIFFALALIPFMHLFAFCVLFPSCELDAEEDIMTCPSQEPRQFFISYYYFMWRVARNIFMLGIHFKRAHDHSILFVWQCCFLNVIGFILYWVIGSVFIGMGMFRHSYLTKFQIKMQRLVNFMNMRKIDKNLKNEIIKHYEYLWILREGKTLQDVFNRFNSACYEEVMFANLGNILQTSVIFKSHPKVIIKDFLSCKHLSHILILINGIIIRVNDVQNQIYILYKGSVQVVGPDLSKIKVLHVGSIFGCLDNVTNHRSTLTYVAKTHCELLCMEATEFYSIITKYPSYYQYFIYLVKTSNIDYIVSESNTSPNTEKMARARVTDAKFIDRRGAVFCKFILNTFTVHRPKEWLNVASVCLCFASFLIESGQKVTLLHNSTMVIICYLLDILFWIKIYINFSESYEDVYGLWVVKRRMIAIRYMKDLYGFFFHFTCIFPVEMISLFFLNDRTFWAIWSYCRLNRLFNIIIVFKYFLSMRNRLNVNVFMTRISYIVLMLITLQQTSMIFMAMFNWSSDDTDPIRKYKYAASIQIHLMSTSILNVHEESKQIFPAPSFFLGLILLTSINKFVIIYVFAEYVACYQVLNYSTFKYGAYLMNIEKEMNSKEISVPLHKRVMQYLENLSKTSMRVQFPRFVKSAPYYLREGVLYSMFGYILRRHPIFKECHSDLVRQIAACFETSYFFYGDFITFIGDIDSQMYFIYDGQVECLSQDNLYYEIVDKTYKAGDSFGFKQMLFNNVGHEYTYKVVSDAVILILKRRNVLPLLDFFPASRHIIYNYNDFAKEAVNLDDALK